MGNLEEPQNADLSLSDVCRVMLEEAGQIADEGSLVCANAPLMLIVLPSPKNVAPIHYRILWHKDDCLWQE